MLAANAQLPEAMDTTLTGIDRAGCADTGMCGGTVAVSGAMYSGGPGT